MHEQHEELIDGRIDESSNFISLPVLQRSTRAVSVVPVPDPVPGSSDHTSTRLDCINRYRYRRSSEPSEILPCFLLLGNCECSIQEEVPVPARSARSSEQS